MATEPQPHLVLAFSTAGGLWLLVGVVVIAVILAAFLLGHRRTAERHKSASTPSPAQVEQARKAIEDPPQHGKEWSTPDEDPEQGHPHR
ncbi:DUF6479 family protein [Streptomyces aureus]|uniref:DUF6479 family protein n=1 Tax=Streptomyces aureus TaxID=193461 RepID=UPI0005699F22|nr:DUF6479 family protein [Streptomyces aureus]